MNRFLRVFVPDNSIGDSGAAALAEALNVNASVKKIELACKQQRLAFFCVSFRFQNSCFAANEIGVAGAVALAGALKGNQTLHEMSISRKRRENCVVLQMSLLFLMRARATCVRACAENRIGDDGAKALADALKSKSLTTADLTSMRCASQRRIAKIPIDMRRGVRALAEISVDFEGAKALADVLADNASLAHIDLGCKP